jgi:hypothetical protein
LPLEERIPRLNAEKKSLNLQHPLNEIGLKIKEDIKN